MRDENELWGPVVDAAIDASHMNSVGNISTLGYSVERLQCRGYSAEVTAPRL